MKTKFETTKPKTALLLIHLSFYGYFLAPLRNFVNSTTGEMAEWMLSGAKSRLANVGGGAGSRMKKQVSEDFRD